MYKTPVHLDAQVVPAKIMYDAPLYHVQAPATGSVISTVGSNELTTVLHDVINRLIGLAASVDSLSLAGGKQKSEVSAEKKKKTKEAKPADDRSLAAYAAPKGRGVELHFTFDDDHNPGAPQFDFQLYQSQKSASDLKSVELTVSAALEPIVQTLLQIAGARGANEARTTLKVDSAKIEAVITTPTGVHSITGAVAVLLLAGDLAGVYSLADPKLALSTNWLTLGISELSTPGLGTDDLIRRLSHRLARSDLLTASTKVSLVDLIVAHAIASLPVAALPNNVELYRNRVASVLAQK